MPFYVSQAFEDLKIVGCSGPMQSLCSKISKLNDIDSTVLILGESGTGKELFARAIQRNSNRREEAFIAINCAALSETLLESELFGFRKGAFTDAKSNRKGYFETCSEGTLFLDEIGEMSPTTQAKILRVIQEKEFIPLGSCQPISINTRIIAATNRDLKKEMKEGRFRADLYYRIAVLTLIIPPVRKRKEDIPLLIKYFSNFYADKFHKKIKKPKQNVLVKASSYDWPGNVRELQNAVERAVVLSDEGNLSLDDLLELSDDEKVADSPHQSEDLQLVYSIAKKHFEQRYIENLLFVSKGNIAEASRLSNQYRHSLYRLIKKYDINIELFKDIR